MSYSQQRRDSRAITDIIDGSLFKQVRAEDAPGDLWISFLLHYDSITLAKSSRPSLDPIQLQIIELPPKLRCCYSNMVLAGLHIGPADSFDIRVLTDFLVDEIDAWNRNPPIEKFEVKYLNSCVSYCNVGIMGDL